MMRKAERPSRGCAEGFETIGREGSADAVHEWAMGRNGKITGRIENPVFASLGPHRVNEITGPNLPA